VSCFVVVEEDEDGDERKLDEAEGQPQVLEMCQTLYESGAKCEKTHGFDSGYADYSGYANQLSQEAVVCNFIDSITAGEDGIADKELSIMVDYLGTVMEWQSGLDTATSSCDKVRLVTYTYVYQRSCECLPVDTAPKIVEVVDGVVISVDGQPVQAVEVERSGNDDNIPTIEGLFDDIQRAIESNVFCVDVQYDAELGYPLSIYINYKEIIADEELIISAML
jgi:hypothetical protein